MASPYLNRVIYICFCSSYAAHQLTSHQIVPATMNQNTFTTYFRRTRPLSVFLYNRLGMLQFVLHPMFGILPYLNQYNKLIGWRHILITVLILLIS